MKVELRGWFVLTLLLGSILLPLAVVSGPDEWFGDDRPRDDQTNESEKFELKKIASRAGGRAS